MNSRLCLLRLTRPIPAPLKPASKEIRLRYLFLKGQVLTGKKIKALRKMRAKMAKQLMTAHSNRWLYQYGKIIQISSQLNGVWKLAATEKRELMVTVSPPVPVTSVKKKSQPSSVRAVQITLAL